MYKIGGNHIESNILAFLTNSNNAANTTNVDVHKLMDELGGKSPFEVVSAAYGKHKSQYQYALAVEDFGIVACLNSMNHPLSMIIQRTIFLKV